MKTKLTNKNTCPKCDSDWNGEDIYEALRAHDAYKNCSDEEVKEIASHYGWTEKNKLKYSRLIGIETEDYDGISYWQCPDCGTTWSRFSCEEVEYEKIIRDDN